MNAEQLWNQFQKENPTIINHYTAWSFGEAPDKLASLVIAGQKIGTASAYDLYAYEKEPLPQVGDYSVILDAKEQAVCIIQTTKLTIVPFLEVSEEHARKEGEGDLSLAYWRKVHHDFFQECYQEDHLPYQDETCNVLCEEFKLVYVAKEL